MGICFCRAIIYFNVPPEINVTRIYPYGTLREAEQIRNTSGVLIEWDKKGIFITFNNYPYRSIPFIKYMPINGVFIYNSLINDLSALENHKLFFLDISNTPIDQLAFMKNCEVTHLRLANLNVCDLTPLESQKIKTLHLARLKYLTDIKPLASLASLEALLITDCPIRDISPICKCKSLCTLFLSMMPVADVTSLQHSKSLLKINLNDTLVDDISPLEKLNLRSLSIENTPASKKDLPRWAKLLIRYGVKPHIRSEDRQPK